MMSIEPGIWQTPTGGYRAEVQVGRRGARAVKHFPPGTPIEAVRTWREQTADLLRARRPTITRGSLAADVQTYLRDAHISKATRKVRTQQLAWWCAQDARIGAPVFTPEQVRAAAEAGRVLVPQPRTLSAVVRQRLPLKRLRECLHVAFAATDPEIDPTEFASTSNSYRTALFHLFSELDQDEDGAINPLKKVPVRTQAGPQLSGQDMRVVAEILKHVRSDHGRDAIASPLRLAVLGWVHITPDQLKKVVPARDFHDVPDAVPEEIVNGLITLTKRPRLKGRRRNGGPLPPPETIPLTPLGVVAMRAFAAEPRAHGRFSNSSLNKVVKRAAARAQAAFAQRQIAVDLSEFTLYHLKHSLATATSVASAGVMNRHGRIVMSPGVQRVIDHTIGSRSSQFYTQAAVDPIVRLVTTALAHHLEQLLRMPLVPSALRVVAGTDFQG